MNDERAIDPALIPEDDEALLAECRVETFRSGGPGGQHQNVTESGVRLVHLPTGVRTSSRTERSQHRNRSIALKRLREKLEELTRERKPRVPTRVPRGQKKKRLEEKKRRGRAKRLRKPPDSDAD
ncbi:MAG: peptide chain release factor-like protein [Gemmatimonadota bacterium]|nr:peptide chain release factor-like protein [Gemmatimonadota bacterium]MDH3421936.1 peptide chain release factor-like protein [Gemmatimonadota bacterium]